MGGIPVYAQGEFAPIVPNFFDNIILFFTLAPVQTILILVGLVMIFIEVNTPGFGISGMVAAICFIVVFGSSAFLGRVGSLELILFLSGLGLLAVEIFITPGFGIMGISGFLLIGFSLVLSMQNFIVPKSDMEWDILGRNALVVIIGMIAAITAIAILALVGPRIRLFDKLTLKTKITGTAGGPDPDTQVAASPQDFSFLLDKIGAAVTTLRPAGKVAIDGHVYPVEADGAFIEKGQQIVVSQIYGNRITVKVSKVNL
jgi:membrane-bound serine protease (ClpP class)